MQGLRGSIRIVVAMFLILVVQTAFGRVLAPYPFSPWLGLPIVFALATAPGVRVVRGASTSFVLGYLYDLFTGNPLGIHALVFVIGYLVAWLCGYLLSFRGVPFEMLLTFVLSFALGGLLDGLRSFVPGGMTWSTSALLLSLFASSFLTALIAPLAFALTRRLDRTAERIAS